MTDGEKHPKSEVRIIIRPKPCAFVNQPTRSVFGFRTSFGFRHSSFVIYQSGSSFGFPIWGRGGGLQHSVARLLPRRPHVVPRLGMPIRRHGQTALAVEFEALQQPASLFGCQAHLFSIPRSSLLLVRQWPKWRILVLIFFPGCARWHLRGGDAALELLELLAQLVALRTARSAGLLHF